MPQEFSTWSRLSVLGSSVFILNRITDYLRIKLSIIPVAALRKPLCHTLGTQQEQFKVQNVKEGQNTALNPSNHAASLFVTPRSNSNNRSLRRLSPTTASCNTHSNSASSSSPN
ncbi:predicted protein [Histoplasma capsulatum H143]|uniref:Uncharacterized protein n=1 Tax=Ajellomyces capsulatus (strain H143) TaxID=544712 RepID=C6HEV9_AJECH|nr:predicted protein [Histoplasma capsulatum H143]